MVDPPDLPPMPDDQFLTLQERPVSLNDIGGCDLRDVDPDPYPSSPILDRTGFAMGSSMSRVVICGWTSDGVRDSCEILDLSVTPYVWRPSQARLMVPWHRMSFTTVGGKVWNIYFLENVGNNVVC